MSAWLASLPLDVYLTRAAVSLPRIITVLWDAVPFESFKTVVSEESIASIYKVERDDTFLQNIVATRVSLRHISEDGVLHSYRCEKLKSEILFYIRIYCRYRAPLYSLSFSHKISFFFRTPISSPHFSQYISTLLPFLLSVLHEGCHRQTHPVRQPR
jgi:hypothetical protein